MNSLLKAYARVSMFLSELLRSSYSFPGVESTWKKFFMVLNTASDAEAELPIAPNLLRRLFQLLPVYVDSLCDGARAVQRKGSIM